MSQIARTAASALQLDEDLTEALALAHDIGHPPFAHAGEEELNRQMSAFGDRFDHNLHALRIVESFEQRYARFPGLNLTFEVREGIVKHSHDIAIGQEPELDEYLPGLRPPLEAQLIDLADEIAYNTADLDDAFSAYMFRASDVASEVPGYAEIYDSVQMQFPGASERERFLEALRQVIDCLASGLIEGTLRRATDSGVTDLEEVRGYPERVATFTEDARSMNSALKRFLHGHVYSAPALVEERYRARRRIADLFAYFLEDPARLPEPYRELASTGAVHRVVCDYIAGMTDGFFDRTHHQLIGSHDYSSLDVT